ncbi:hypothetical protein HanXRQr2_Chr12g0533841 [Helianthus annuus]|uniref:Uncharacterized protein n=1 Tax=Helianthus annuus TaxID=4232 RepID=A0A9K3HFE6_HELAN|nr:hypothetical protein HanXRQr2_Chr12g0533841 [Helianthus annuus]
MLMLMLMLMLMEIIQFETLILPPPPTIQCTTVDYLQGSLQSNTVCLG